MWINVSEAVCCVYNDQAIIKSLGVQLDHNLVWTDHMFEVWSHHCLVSAMPRFRKTGILMVAVWTSLESIKAQRLHIHETRKIKMHFESSCASCWLAWITFLRPEGRPNWFLTVKKSDILKSPRKVYQIHTESEDSVGILILDSKTDHHFPSFSGDHSQLKSNLEAK